MTKEAITEVEQELKRFTKRLKDAKARLDTDKYVSFTGCKETGALRRSALDLKNALTLITQNK